MGGPMGFRYMYSLLVKLQLLHFLFIYSFGVCVPGNDGIVEAKFRQFDVISDVSDHYYVINKSNQNGSSENCFTGASSSVYKKIMQEWKILQNGLPDSIHVRVYEERIGLLRAAVVGVQGTPYHDGLYFFDIAFPVNYPNTPPLVRYKSYGLELNPHLYSSGHVCVSLLNTWIGKGSERWDPSRSTILEVLVSLQGIVLNEKPNSNLFISWQDYSKHVFQSSCKTMLYLIVYPPKNFKDLIFEHFRERANATLRACRAYRDGQLPVGLYCDHQPCFSSQQKIKVSGRFKKSIDRVHRELFNAFTF